MMRVGIFGGGQLGRMLALAGQSLDIQCRVLDPAPDASAGKVTEQVIGLYDDPKALERFSRDLDVATYEFEHLPLPAVQSVARQRPVYPPVSALEVIQDRLAQKTFLDRLHIPVAPFASVSSRADLEKAMAHLGLPAVLKTRHAGYDGKGQWVLRQAEDVDAAWRALGGGALLLEALIPFERELSLIGVAGRAGEVAFYPLVENHHQEQILRWSVAPAPHSSGLQSEAERHALRLIEAFGYVGVLAIEFFQHEGKLIANEVAPRVHNSGHWTLEGAETSQFENHLRAILGLPIGSTALRGCAAMMNFIGELPEPRAWLALPGAHLHLYGKAPRPGRKLGHVTFRAETLDRLREQLERLPGVTSPRF